MTKHKNEVKDIVTLNDLEFDPMNVNRGTDRGGSMIDASLRDVKAGRSVLTDRNGVLLAGNKTTEQRKKIANADDIIVVRSDGNKLVVVQRTDLDTNSNDPKVRQRAIKAALYDNRTGQVSLDFDPNILAQLQAEDETLLKGLWSDDELAELLQTVPDFQPVGADEQPRLDQKAPITCPHCGEEFIPK